MAVTPDVSDVETWLDKIDPTTLKMRDATHLRALIAASEAAEAAHGALISTVAAARAGGESWAVIGMALGITRQAAQQRFGPKM